MRVTALYRYPVKSLGGESVTSLEVAARGFTDDRRWMLVDPDGTFISQRTHHHLATYSASVSGSDDLVIADGAGRKLTVSGARAVTGPSTTVTVWDDVVTAREVGAPDLGTFLQLPAARLVYMAPDSVRPIDPRYAEEGETVSFADGYPYLITTEASLRELEHRVGYGLGMLRFRPNLVVDGTDAFAEDDWKRLRIGDTTFRLPKPCARCIMVTLEPGSGGKDLAVLSTLASFRRVGNKTLFGMNAIADTAGARVAVGDAVEVLPG